MLSQIILTFSEVEEIELYKKPIQLVDRSARDLTGFYTIKQNSVRNRCLN